MNVSLTPELEQFIAAKVESGFYHSASEVIREGLRVLAEQDAYKQMRIAKLNAEIDKGMKDIEEGRMIDGEEAYRQILARRAAYTENNKPKDA